MGKKPRAEFSKKFNKVPRTDPSITSPLDQYPSWQLQIIDLQGTWSWNNVNREMLVEDILPKLKNFESMYWKDIINRNNHEIPVEKISKDAQKRLQELRQDDIQNIISLRLTGERRVWGIRSGSTLKLLWWDPTHTVYPSLLKHT